MIVHSYDRATRTIEFRIFEQVTPGIAPTEVELSIDERRTIEFRIFEQVTPGIAPTEVELSIDERLYFWVHLYDSTPDPINLVIEAP